MRWFARIKNSHAATLAVAILLLILTPCRAANPIC